MALRRKLYYTVDFAGATGTIGGIFDLMPGTGQDVDDYGNLLNLNLPNGALNAIARCRQAVGGWFQPGSMNVIQGVDFCVQFGTGAGATFNIVADPSLFRRVRARVRTNTLVAGSAVTGRGRLYIQRQHSEEV